MLLGPTGAGKTTTLRLVAGLERPDSGSIVIGGRDVTQLEPAARDVAFVFQQYSLYPHLTVVRKPRLPAALAGAQADRGRDQAPRRGGGEAGAHRPQAARTASTRLSGGEMQRVAIGRALVRKPAIYLMDEPLSSLDAKLRGDLRLELKRIQAELGATMLYVTHDQIEAMTMADRIGILADGRLVQIGTPQRDLHGAGEPACRRTPRPAGDQPAARRPAAGSGSAGRHQDDRRAHRASDDRARPRTAMPTARSTGSSIWATRTTCI